MPHINFLNATPKYQKLCVALKKLAPHLFGNPLHAPDFTRVFKRPGDAKSGAISATGRKEDVLELGKRLFTEMQLYLKTRYVYSEITERRFDERIKFM